MTPEKRCILLDELPLTVEVEGGEYEIDTDFRAGILFEQLMRDRTVDKPFQMAATLQLYYGDDIPPNKSEAYKAVVEFYLCGRQLSEKKDSNARGAIGKRRMNRIYDFEVDAALFFAAFLAQYRIDLNEIEYLHWWKFMALFEGIDRSSELHRVMEIRQTDVGSIENPREKQRILRLQERYRIDAGLSAEDKVEIAGSVFSG